MNETFWGLYKAQVSELRSCATPEEANMVMLETAKFLVENIDLSDATIARYDKLDIRRLFAAHNALGGAVTAFYDAKKNQLDPVAQNGAIGQRIASISDQITSTAEALEKLRELEEELFARVDELESLENELDAWRQKASHLHDIEKNAANEIQKFKEQVDCLEGIVSNSAKEIAFWKSHLGENSAIVIQMQAYNIASVDAFIERIETLKESIQRDLRIFDEIIKAVVDTETHIREAVLKCQGKMI